MLDSGTGTINALVGFTTLDIDGAGATLSAGYIGAPAAATQNMANLITKGGLPILAPSPTYMFDSFNIGEVVPVASTDIIGDTTFDEIVTILKQPASVDTKYQTNSDDNSLLTPYSNSQTIADVDSSLILIHPDLLREGANPAAPNEQMTYLLLKSLMTSKICFKSPVKAKSIKVMTKIRAIQA